jgi:hypothetical protein
MSSDTFANLVKSSSVSIPLEEYKKLEPYIKGIYDIQSLKDENKKMKETIEKQNERLETYHSRDLWESHLRGITELWYFSQTGIYLRQCEVLGKLQCLTSKIKSSIDDDTMYDEYGCGDIYQDKALTEEGPFCIKGCKDIDVFCEKVLNCFENESFREYYGILS